MKLKTLITFGLLSLVSLLIATLLAYVTRWQMAMAGLIPLLSGLMGLVLILMTLLARGLAKV
ncbi:MAG: hypothetical protein AB1801_09195, partial [Chloroflexota bacterium]